MGQMNVIAGALRGDRASVSEPMADGVRGRSPRREVEG
jgi:hypothetical protein